MTEYQFLNGEYNGNTGNIDLWVRSHQTGEKKSVSITGFRPYCYVNDEEYVPHEEWVVGVEPGYKHMSGNAVKRIIATDPNAIGKNRDRFSIAYEADIRYVQRMLIDTGIFSSFSTDVYGSLIPFDDLRPIRKILDPVICYLDIEVRTKARFPNFRNPTQPVISVTFWDTTSRRYITIIIDDIESQSWFADDWLVIRVKTYERFHELALRYLNDLLPDIISGWNINFDVAYWSAWLNHMNFSPLPLYPVEVFDLLEAYNKLRPNLGNTLKEVVLREDIVKEEDMVSKQFQIGMYEDKSQRDRFILYNKNDVEYCIKINSKYNIMDTFWKQKNFAGLADIRDTTHHTRRHDILWLRMAHQKKIILPSAPKEKSDKRLEEGAIVFEPPEGLIPDLTVVDMSRYYPNILKAFAKETSPDIWGILGPAVIDFLSDERDYWDAQLAKCTPGTAEHKVTKVNQTVAKHFLSGAWGYFAYPGSRIYSKEKGDIVLQKSREGLIVVRDSAAANGFELRYGDTDSALIESPMDQVDHLVDIINGSLHDWAVDQGVPPEFKVKEDRYGKNNLFIRTKDNESGAKKRYAQWVVREDGRPCDYIMIKGFDTIRGNTSPLTRSLQREAIESSLRGTIQTTLDKIIAIRNRILSRECNINEIAIPVNLHQEFNESSTTHYYRAAIYNNKYIGEEIIPGDLVRYFKVGKTPETLEETTSQFGKSMMRKYPPTDWLAYIENNKIPEGFEPDYDWIVEQTLRSPLERILNVVGVVWDQVEGKKDMTKMF